MKACSKCKKAENENLFPCDSCKSEFCNTCSDLSASEIRCLSLKNRKLLFLCEECEKGLSLVPVLIKKVNELQAEVNNLKINSTSSISTDLTNQENLITEMLDRQNRMSNVVIFNVKESQKNSRTERNEDNIDTVKDILKDINVSKDNLKAYRLGKYDPNKNRPIKVIFNSAEDAKYVLKNKINIKVPSIRIYGDQTRAQREYYLFVKQKLQDIIDNGDDTKTIRYINNKPTIVNKKYSQQPKN